MHILFFWFFFLLLKIFYIIQFPIIKYIKLKQHVYLMFILDNLYVTYKTPYKLLIYLLFQ